MSMQRQQSALIVTRHACKHVHTYMLANSHICT